MGFLGEGTLVLGTARDMDVDDPAPVTRRASGLNWVLEMGGVHQAKRQRRTGSVGNDRGMPQLEVDLGR